MAFSIPNPSHSHEVIPIPEIYALWDLFPFPYYFRKLISIPPIPIPANGQITYESKNFKPHNVYIVFRVHSHQKHHF